MFYFSSIIVNTFETPLMLCLLSPILNSHNFSVKPSSINVKFNSRFSHGEGKIKIARILLPLGNSIILFSNNHGKVKANHQADSFTTMYYYD